MTAVDPRNPKVGDRFRNREDHGRVITVLAVDGDEAWARDSAGFSNIRPLWNIVNCYEPIPEPEPLPPLVDGTVVLRERSFDDDRRWLTSDLPMRSSDTGRSLTLHAEDHSGDSWINVRLPRCVYAAAMAARGAGRQVGIWVENETEGGW